MLPPTLHTRISLTLGILLCLLLGTSALFSQVLLESPILVDTTSKELDWDPVSQYPHPEHTLKRDPWINTAKELSKSRQPNIDINKRKPFRGCDSSDRALIKQLGIKAFRVSEPAGYLASSNNGEGIDMIFTQYQSPVPFEIRNTPYVWVIVVKNSQIKELPDIAKLIGMDLSKYHARFVPTSEPEGQGYEYQLKGDNLSPFLNDAILFRTSDSIVFSGSKIMGDIPFPVSHAETTWLRGWLPKTLQ